MMSNRELVYDAIKNGYKTNFDIAAYTKLTSSQITSTIGWLKDEGLIFNAGILPSRKKGQNFCIYALTDPTLKDYAKQLNIMYKSSFANVGNKISDNIFSPMKSKTQAYSSNEMDYGKLPEYTWEEVYQEAKSIFYQKGDYLTKLPFTLE